MSQYVPARLRREIRQRANRHCEYCLIHEDDVLIPHEPDNVIATKHGGQTDESNLAWACFLCNRAKGSDIASVDPESGDVVRMFSPRTDLWGEHFQLQPDARLIGRTPIGGTTVSLLQLNRLQHIEIRQLLASAGLYPPPSEKPDADETN